MLKDWVVTQLGEYHDLMLPWNCVGNAISTPNWHGATSIKVLGGVLPEMLDLAKTTVLGGICPIFTGDEKEMREKGFTTVAEFGAWIESWYPRLDQIHDTIGIPSKVGGVIYVCEDSLFGRKLQRMLGLDAEEVSKIIRSVHENQGHPIICRWLQQWGYHGPVEVVYTSDLESELGMGVRIWKRIGGFKPKDQDYLKVVLMYTAFWPDVLGIKGPAVVYEPANHTNHRELPKEVRPWFRDNPYGSEGSLNAQLGLVGYLPFWSARGHTRKLPRTEVPNLANWGDFQILEEDSYWYAVNLLFAQGVVRDQGVTSLPKKEIGRRIALDLRTYFG